MRCVWRLVGVLVLASTCSFGQAQSIQEADWNHVDSLVEAESNYEARALCGLLLRHSVADSNYGGFVRGLVTQSTLLALDIEQPLDSVEAHLQASADTLPAPFAGLANALLAEFYYRVLTGEEQYRILERKGAIGFAGTVSTYSADELRRRMLTCLQKALANPAALQAIPASELEDAMFAWGSTDLDPYPTAYELLLHHALNILEGVIDDEDDSPWPSTDRLPDSRTQEAMLKGNDHFLKFPADSTHPVAALLIQAYQELTRRAQQGRHPLLLGLTTIRRLSTYAFLTNTPDAYRQAETAIQQLVRELSRMNREQERAEDEAEVENAPEASPKALSEAADFQLLMRYQRIVIGPESKRARDLEALAQITARKHPQSTLHRIFQKALSPHVDLTVGADMPTGQPVEVLLEYGNTRQIELRVLPRTALYDSLYVRYRRLPNLEHDSAEIWFIEQLRQLHAMQVLRLELPPSRWKTSQHRAQLASLPAGTYLVVAMPADTGSWFSLHEFKATSLLLGKLSAVHPTYQLLDRHTGFPVDSLSVHLSTNGAVPRDSLLLLRQSKGKLIRQPFGQVQLIPTSLLYRYQFDYKLVFRRGQDSLIQNEYLFQLPYGLPVGSVGGSGMSRDHLLIDRPLYRPGQEVAFHVIRTWVAGDSVRPRLDDVAVHLHDANNQVVGSVTVAMNRYGSARGILRIPEGRLPGRYSLQAGNTEVPVQVEQYKRPRFLLQVDTVREALRLGDVLVLTGKVLTYSGAGVGGAKGSVSVECVIDDGDYGYHNGATSVLQQPLATQSDGSFSVRIPLGKRKRPEDAGRYTCTLQFTDPAGETRGWTQTWKVNDSAATLTWGVWPATTKGNVVELALLNLAGEPISGRIQLQAYRLAPPAADSLQKLSLPSHPMSARLPLPGASLVWQTRFQLTGRQKILLPDSTWLPGRYQVLITARTGRGEVRQSSFYVSVHSLDQPSPRFAVGEVVEAVQTRGQVGDSALIWVGGLPDSVFVSYRIQTDTTSALRGIGLKGEPQLLTIPLPASGMGGMYVHFHWVYHNQTYEQSIPLEVLPTRLPLRLAWKASDAKLMPNQEANWRLLITDSLGHPVRAEVALTAYDASLDALLPEPWDHIWQPSFRTPRRDPISIDFKRRWGWGINYNQHREANPLRLSDVNWRASEEYIEFDWLDYETWSSQDNNARAEFAAAQKRQKEERLRVLVDSLLRKHGVWLEGQVLGEWDSLPKQARVVAVIRGIPKFVDTDSSGRFRIQVLPEPFVLRGILIPPTLVVTFEYEFNTLPLTPLRVLVPLPNQNNTASSNRYNQAQEGVVSVRGAATMEKGDTYDSFGVDMLNEVVVVGYGYQQRSNFTSALSGVAAGIQVTPAMAPQVRNQLQETAFFRTLHTDSNGIAHLTFSAPQQLTRWRVLGLAYTPQFAAGFLESSFTTYRPVQVLPNLPRFLREGDQATLTAQVFNTTNQSISGRVRLRLLAMDSTSLTASWGIRDSMHLLTVPAQQNRSIHWPLTVPSGIGQVQVEISFQNDSLSDGERVTLPVLSRRVLVTEAARAVGRSGDTLRLAAPATLRQPTAAALRVNANLQADVLAALPYLIQDPNECVEQLFNRFSALHLGSFVLQHQPQLRSLVANGIEGRLKGNQAVLATQLAATPWLREALAEDEAARALAILLDQPRLNAETRQLADKLESYRNPDGGYAWFPGFRSDRFLTQYLLLGSRKLTAIGVATPLDTTQALYYVLRQLVNDFQQAKRRATAIPVPDAVQIQALRVVAAYRLETEPGSEQEAAIRHVRQLAITHVQELSHAAKAELALALYDFGDTATARNLLRKLAHEARRNSPQGMYWDALVQGNSQAGAIYAHSLLLEAFQRILPERAYIVGLRQWLLLHRQLNRWPSTLTTATAAWALLGGPASAPSGIGEFRQTEALAPTTQTFNNPNVPTQFAVRVPLGSEFATATAYWQAWVPMDSLLATTPGPLQLTRILLREIVEPNGHRRYQPVSPSIQLNTGDRIRTQFIIRCDRQLSYVHLQDFRSAALEPASVLSGFQWQDGLGFYQTTEDLATNFYLYQLPPGTYVLHVDATVGQTGTYHLGRAEATCMYEPAIYARTTGGSIQVK